MLIEGSQREKDKHGMISFIYRNQKKKNQAHKYRKYIGGCQRQGVGTGEVRKGSQKVQTFSYKISLERV